MTSVISVIDVVKRYATNNSTLTALEDINLEVSQGEFISLVGPSGCGKSTLLSLMDGLLTPTSGEIRYRGEPLTKPRREIGVMFQQPVLLPWRTVEDNVLLPGEILKAKGPEVVRTAHRMLELVGLSGFEKSYPRHLSGGMAQRVALCRALAFDPEILLLDEPFGALDEFTREAMNFELLKVFMETNKTIVFVTHNVGEAVFMADRIVVMTPRPGRLAEIVEPALPRPRIRQMMRTIPYLDAVFKIREILGIA